MQETLERLFIQFRLSMWAVAVMSIVGNAIVSTAIITSCYMLSRSDMSTLINRIDSAAHRANEVRK